MPVVDQPEQQAVPVAQDANCVRLEDVTPAVAAAFANDACLIWSGEHGLYWRADAAGYTSQRDEASRYTIGTAYAKTRHCGPDKRIEFHRLTEPARKADRFDPAHPCKSGEGAEVGKVEVRSGDANSHIFDDRILVDGEVIAFSSEPWSSMIAEALSVPDATQTREAEDAWLPISDDAKSGAIVELVVDYSDGDHPLADGILACTIGFNTLADTGLDEWKFAGWCWTHDHFVQGKGTPVAWRPSRLNATDDGLPALPARDAA